MAKGQIKQKQMLINKNQFENLCKMQCTEQEIQGWFGVSKDTLIRWCKNNYGVDFATIYQEKRQGGKISLRRTQWQLAEKNPTMAIWLGKQYLGQRDMQQEEQQQNQMKEMKITIVDNTNLEKTMYDNKEI